MQLQRRLHQPAQPSGGQSVGASFTTRLSGDALDGVYQATVNLPAYSEQGTWTVDPAGLYDKAGNHTYIQSPTLAAAGYPATITQNGPGDRTPPQLHSLAFSPTSVDTSGGPQTILSL
ncbi:MAG TPA: hypothetical protein VJ456_06665 [Acidimicrobiia bacterium]|nr:hypothetical protein [Acidimicrobiia bacterium]